MDTLILTYHRVNDWSNDPLTVHPETFRQQLKSLKKRHRIVSLEELVSAKMKKADCKENLAAITFDDGYYDNYLFAFPILKELSCPATFFLTVSYVGTDELLPRDRKKGNLQKDRLMNWGEVLEMSEAGFEFGSHSSSHLNLTTAGPAEAKKEIAESRIFLEERLKKPVIFFCYPFGSYSPEVEKLVKEAGYKAAFVTQQFSKFNPIRGFLRNARRQEKADPYALARVGIYHHTSLWQFRLKMRFRPAD